MIQLDLVNSYKTVNIVHREREYDVLVRLLMYSIDAGLAFNAKLLESFGDLVRMLMSKTGPFLTFSTHLLPAIMRTGPEARQPSKYK